MADISRLFLLGLLIVAVVNSQNTSNPDSTTTETAEGLSIRLPTSLVPVHYLVRLQPFINGNLAIDGYVEITLEVKEDTNKIVFHIADIVTKNDTTMVYQIDSPSKAIPIQSQEFDKDREFYIATLGQTLTKGGVYVISLNFEGFLNSDMKGFYKSSYLDDDGNTVLLAATQFEATDARRAFPCFDEPDFKAKFTIEMAREEGMNTVSNMPIAATVPVEEQDGWFWDRFNTTPPMSSYLVAFIVSDFVHLEADTTAKYKFGVWARKNVIESGKYAVELGPKVSTFYEGFFDVPFPLPKQDMAAIPDFSAHGMENWGLITYRESSFLYDPKVASAFDKFYISTVISHELAHQWFGDLVTPAWWNDLWLNEGFASYMEYIGLRETAPDLRSVDQFVVLDLHSAFALDALETSHPISVVVHNPDEINGLFDQISYSKGASIIRMMSSYLTEDVFRSGLKNYLTKLSYLNAEQDDLWSYLTEEGHSEGTLDTDVTVKDIMDTWTLQMGYPLVTVNRNNDGTFTLTQKRFVRGKKDYAPTSEDSHDYKWWIPITYTIQSEATFEEASPQAWMSPEETSITIENVQTSATDWVIFNLHQNGYYRVNYDEQNWNAISSQLASDPTVFPDSNRAQIIDDALNLARNGEVSYEIVLNLLTYLKNEKEFVPIMAAFNNFGYLNRLLLHKGGYGLFKKYLLSLIVPLYEEVTFTDSLTDPHLDQRKRAEVLRWACDLGYTPCVDSAVSLYKQWIDSPEDSTIISPNLKSIVYCTAIREGGVKEWKFAWDQYLATKVGTEQIELLQAMGCSKEPWILSEFLNRSLTEGQGIKKQMVRYIIPALAKTEIGKFIGWGFVKNNWNRIIDYFGTVSFVLAEIIESTTETLNTGFHIKEFEIFRKTYEGNFSAAARTVEQAAENVQNNRKWLQNYYGVIMQWLTDNGFESDL